jgi:hypothetical protein
VIEPEAPLVLAPPAEAVTTAITTATTSGMVTSHRRLIFT